MPEGYMLSLASCTSLDSMCFEINISDVDESDDQLGCLNDSLLCCAETISTLPASSYIVLSSGRPEWRSPISTIDINIILDSSSREFITGLVGNGQGWAKMEFVLRQRKFAGIRGVYLNFEIRKGGVAFFATDAANVSSSGEPAHDYWVENMLGDMTRDHFSQPPLKHVFRLDVTFEEAENGTPWCHP